MNQDQFWIFKAEIKAMESYQVDSDFYACQKKFIELYTMRMNIVEKKSGWFCSDHLFAPISSTGIFCSLGVFFPCLLRLRNLFQ